MLMGLALAVGFIVGGALRHWLVALLVAVLLCAALGLAVPLGGLMLSAHPAPAQQHAAADQAVLNTLLLPLAGAVGMLLGRRRRQAGWQR